MGEWADFPTHTIKHSLCFDEAPLFKKARQNALDLTNGLSRTLSTLPMALAKARLTSEPAAFFRGFGQGRFPRDGLGQGHEARMSF